MSWGHFWLSWLGVFLVLSRWGPEILLSTPQYSGQPNRVTWPWISTVGKPWSRLSSTFSSSPKCLAPHSNKPALVSRLGPSNCCPLDRAGCLATRISHGPLLLWAAELTMWARWKSLACQHRRASSRNRRQDPLQEPCVWQNKYRPWVRLVTLVPMVSFIFIPAAM